MAFDIDFHYNNEPMNKIKKTINSGTLLFTCSGVLRDESSVVDPVILIETTNPTAANYAYINEFSRYYYIRNWEAVRNGLWRCTMHCDVLKTFSEGILGSPCVVAKSSNRFNLFLNDSDYKCYQDEYVSVQTFPHGFQDHYNSYILILIGDKTDTPPST